MFIVYLMLWLDLKNLIIFNESCYIKWGVFKGFIVECTSGSKILVDKCVDVGI